MTAGLEFLWHVQRLLVNTFQFVESSAAKQFVTSKKCKQRD